MLTDRNFEYFCPSQTMCSPGTCLKTGVCRLACHAKTRHWASWVKNRDSTPWYAWRCMFVTGISFLLLCFCACHVHGFGQIQCALGCCKNSTEEYCCASSDKYLGIYCINLHRKFREWIKALFDTWKHLLLIVYKWKLLLFINWFNNGKSRLNFSCCGKWVSHYFIT
jgi:hypothetical protein